MNILSLDVGRHRTGIAFVDHATGVPIALATLHHEDAEDLINQVRMMAEERSVFLLVCGLPLLPSGAEGAQCEYTRSIASALEQSGFSVVLLDERYTTPHHEEIDGNAAAACQLLLTFLERRKRPGLDIDK